MKSPHVQEASRDLNDGADWSFYDERSKTLRLHDAARVPAGETHGGWLPKIMRRVWYGRLPASRAELLVSETVNRGPRFSKSLCVQGFKV